MEWKKKEYNYYNKLIFEEEYSNGQRHEKYKAYDYDKLIFEGEYLNGKRHGKGKEYHPYYNNSELVFEGE